MSNIHSTVNLIALCSVCHYAFDAEEWTFLSVGMSEWIQAANAEPEKNFIPIWNAQRNIQYRPWRLMVDTQASNDKNFNLASTNNPLKTWTGELGALILSLDHLHSIKFRNPSTGLAEAIQEFRKLCALWVSYESPYSNREGFLCRHHGNSGDDQKEDQNGENKKNEGGGDLEEEDKWDDGRSMGDEESEESEEYEEYEESPP